MQPAQQPYPPSVGYPQQPQYQAWPQPQPRKPGVKWLAVIGGVIAFVGMLISVAAVGMLLEAAGSALTNQFAAISALYVYLAGQVVFGLGVMIGFIGLALPRAQ